MSLYSILLAFVDEMRMDYNEKHYKEALKRFNDSHNVDMLGSLPVIHKLNNGNFSLTPITHEQVGYRVISTLAPEKLKDNTQTQAKTRDKNKRAVYRGFQWDMLYDSCRLYQDFVDGGHFDSTEQLYLLARNLCGAENGKKHFLEIISQREEDSCGNMNWKEILNAIIKSDVPLASCNECQYCCFSLDDHIRLHWWCEQLTKRGIKFMQSNSYTPIIASLYGCYDIQLVQARRSINCNGDGRGAVNEVIIRNYI